MEYIYLCFALFIGFLISNWLVLIEHEDLSVDTVISRNYESFLQPLLFLVLASFSFYLLYYTNDIAISVVYILMVVSTVFDLKYQLAPDFINAMILLVGVMSILVTEGHLQALAEPMILGTTLVVLLLVFSLIGSSMTMGGGDIKLLFALCFTLSFDEVFVMIFLYALVATIITLPYCFIKKISLFEFKAPALPVFTVAYVLTVMFGTRVIDFYVTGGWFV